MGLRLAWLGTAALSWRDLLVIVQQSPTGSAVDRARDPDNAMWGLSEHLLATAIDVLQEANWQRQGDEKAPRPAPVQRPGIEGTQPKHRGHTREEVDAFLNRLNPRPDDEQPDGGGAA